MTTLYFSFFHSYLNYGNIARASTTKLTLRKIASQQRQAVNAIPKNEEIANSRKFMEENGILNAYKLISNTKKYLQSDWVRGVQYYPYLYSVFNIYTLLLNKENQHSISVAKK